jgi:HlyD family secretion protein
MESIKNAVFGGIMDQKSKIKKQKRRNILIIAVVILLMAAGGGFAYYKWGRQSTVSAQSTTSTTKTTTAKLGTLIISASGTGTLVAGKQVDLGFPVSGTLAEVNVKVGDKVQAGDVLAVLADLDTLQAKINSAQVDLTDAKKALDDLQKNAGETLGQAQLDLATAQKAYTDAKSAFKTSSMTRCDDTTTNAYYSKYLTVVEKLDRINENGYTKDEYLTLVKPVEDTRDTAYSNYVYCSGFTSYEIASSQATLVKTEAALKIAQENLDTITKNAGIDPDALAAAQNKVATAELALKEAQANLDGATMKSTIAGTVLSVGGEVGDKVTTATFISVADLAHPNVKFYVDETDMDKVAVGYEVQVVFDALPDQTFTGKVIQVEPKLVTVSNAAALQGLASVDLGVKANTLNLPEGLNAAIEVIGGKAENAVLVPVEALKDLGDGEYAVFVVGADGQPKLTVVKVGLMDYTSAVITEGLKAGDVVTTGIVETK